MSWYTPWDGEIEPEMMVYPEDAREWCTDHRPTVPHHLVRHNSDETVRLLWIEYLTDDRDHDGFVPDYIEPEWCNSDIVGFECQQCALLYEQAVIAAGHSKYGGPTRELVITNNPRTVLVAR